MSGKSLRMASPRAGAGAGAEAAFSLPAAVFPGTGWLRSGRCGYRPSFFTGHRLDVVSLDHYPATGTELAHLRRELPPAPEPPPRILLRQVVTIRPSCQKTIPPLRTFGMYPPEQLVLALEHRRAEVAADPLDALVVKRVHR